MNNDRVKLDDPCHCGCEYAVLVDDGYVGDMGWKPCFMPPVFHCEECGSDCSEYIYKKSQEQV